jgi:hypothetical protein
MTYEDIRLKLLSRWWLIIAFAVGFTLFFYPWSNASYYKASIGIGIAFNGAGFESTDQSASQAYVDSLQQFSLYLSNRFKSVEVQSSVAKKAGLGVGNFNPISSFYTVTEQSGGFISINYDAGTEEAAGSFITAIQTQYKELVETERSRSQIQAFRVSPNTEFITDISQVRRSTQFQLLPSIAGLMIGVAIAIVVPYKSKPKQA